MLISHDATLVAGLQSLFASDSLGTGAPGRRPPGDRLVTGPDFAREAVRDLIAGATRSIRVLDHKLSDPDIITLLRDRRESGIVVSVLGPVWTGPLEPHGKLLIVDESRAMLGSMALSTLSLDFRREVSVRIDDVTLVRRLNAYFQELTGRAGASAWRLPGDQSI